MRNFSPSEVRDVDWQITMAWQHSAVVPSIISHSLLTSGDILYMTSQIDDEVGVRKRSETFMILPHFHMHSCLIVFISLTSTVDFYLEILCLKSVVLLSLRLVKHSTPVETCSHEALTFFFFWQQPFFPWVFAFKKNNSFTNKVLGVVNPVVLSECLERSTRDSCIIKLTVLLPEHANPD